MAAEDNLSPTQFFHGTSHDLAEGDHIAPNMPGHLGSVLPHAYATPDLDSARYYAGRSAKSRNARHGLAIHKPSVYNVEPLGSHEPDPWDPDTPSVRSEAGFRVLGKVE